MIEFGWVVPVEGSYEDGPLPKLLGLEGQILPAVARRFQSLWVYDHFYGFASPQNAYLEAWTALTWLAARFPSMQIGTIVLGIGYRNPALLAKMATTLHVLSQGRLVLGLGAGWREEEYRAYNYPFPRAAVRIRQVEEAVQLIRRMWTEAVPNYQGEHFQIEAAYCDPKPVPPGPIMIGGDGPQLMMPVIGRQADWWNAGEWSDVEEVKRRRDILRRSAEAAGRDPDSIRLTQIISSRPWPKDGAETRAWLDYLSQAIEVGFSYFMIDSPIDDSEQIDRFSEGVIQILQAEAG
jgi:alkanesulfonate monooxygenase SsuD/methylene tetrahydromethanopterin reductase-like flavin-dependent oxidoreductase (luciferase family)